MVYKKKCQISMTLWGDWHVDAFLKLNLRSMLAPGNMPEFASKIQTQYIIYTPASDQKRIEKSSAFQKLKELVEVRFVELSAEDIGQPIPTHQKIWDIAIRDALQRQSYIILMPPDVIWSENSLGHLADLVLKGKKAVFLNWHLRSVADTLIPQFYKKYGENGENVCVSGQELVQMSLEHLHPICGAYLRNSECFPRHPEMIFWPVENEGVLMKVLALTPFIFDPRQVALTKTKLVAQCDKPEDMHFVTDSDDLFMVSLAPLGKDFDWYRRIEKMNYVSISKWWTYYDSGMNDLLVQANYRLHCKPCTEEVWQKREYSARILMRKLVYVRELYRIYAAARELKCNYAASIIASALYTGCAEHLLKKGAPVTVFLPEDDALKGVWNSKIHPLIQPSSKKSLIRYLKAHFLRSEDLKTLSDPSLGIQAETEHGSRLDLCPFTFNQAQVVRGPEWAGQHVVYVINQSLA